MGYRVLYCDECEWWIVRERKGADDGTVGRAIFAHQDGAPCRPSSRA